MAASTSKAPPDKEEPPRLQPLFFEALKSDGSNYLKWSATVKMHLVSEDMADALLSPTLDTVTAAAKASTILLIQKHMDMSLQEQYVQGEDPAVLWRELSARYSQERRLHLPGTRRDWINLRVMDFSNLTSYNNELHRIISKLRLCGERITEEDLIDKTITSLPPACTLLGQ